MSPRSLGKAGAAAVAVFCLAAGLALAQEAGAPAPPPPVGDFVAGIYDLVSSGGGFEKSQG